MSKKEQMTFADVQKKTNKTRKIGEGRRETRYGVVLVGTPPTTCMNDDCTPEPSGGKEQTRQPSERPAVDI
jgi:hypothetical protein